MKPGAGRKRESRRMPHDADPRGKSALSHKPERPPEENALQTCALWEAQGRTFAEMILTVETGTSPMPRRLPVGTAAILSTTSVPETTVPKTQ